MDIKTQWLKPPKQIGGLDHLGVQATCINLYGMLLPGITNVTDRLRYYSFYPWLIWAFDQAGHRTYNAEWIERFRRAECLHTLISHRHAAACDYDNAMHAGAAVGSDALARPAQELQGDSSLRLSDYSLREGAVKRYFKNKLGGLGQYYFGVLRELRVLEGDSAKGVLFKPTLGRKLAEAMDASVDRQQFLAAVDKDRVTGSELDAMASFCHCQLASSDNERAMLADLLFSGTEEDSAIERRQSLQLILDLAKQMSSQSKQLQEQQFRFATYSGALPNGDEWLLPDNLKPTRERWRAYTRSEVFSIAMQGLFYCVLDAYEISGAKQHSVEAIVDWYASTPESKEALAMLGDADSMNELHETHTTTLPAFDERASERHELNLAEKIVELTRKDTNFEERREVLAASMQILINLVLRSKAYPPNKEFADLTFAKGYFNFYPVNVKSFLRIQVGPWATLSPSAWLQVILKDWCLNNHIHVALRKLRGQSQSTFRLRPAELGFEVVSVPPAVHTQPRFKQSVQVLRDMGLLAPNEAGCLAPTPIASDFMETST